MQIKYTSHELENLDWSRVEQLRFYLKDSYAFFCSRNELSDLGIIEMTEQEFADIWDAAVEFIQDSY